MLSMKYVDICVLGGDMKIYDHPPCMSITLENDTIECDKYIWAK